MTSPTFCRVLASVTLLASAAACGDKPDATQTPPATPAVVAAPAGPVKPCPTCKVIEVQMITDDKGNYFKPARFEAHQGDVVRFTLVTGVHNVHFLADSNHMATFLPAASELLQLPGQTKDILMDFPPGTYYFQCDPHAALGMVGHVKVESRD